MYVNAFCGDSPLNAIVIIRLNDAGVMLMPKRRTVHCYLSNGIQKQQGKTQLVGASNSIRLRVIAARYQSGPSRPHVRFV